MKRFQDILVNGKNYGKSFKYVFTIRKYVFLEIGGDDLTFPLQLDRRRSRGGPDASK